jgi:hypothetical protein
MTKQEILNLILMLLPLILIQLSLVIYSLVDLSRRAQVRGRRWAWGVGLLLTALTFPTGIIVAGVYLAWGRHVEA